MSEDHLRREDGIIRWVRVYRMSWDPNTEHGDLNATEENSSSPLRRWLANSYTIYSREWFLL